MLRVWMRTSDPIQIGSEIGDEEIKQLISASKARRFSAAWSFYSFVKWKKNTP